MSGHDTSTTYGDSWVSYADSVAAQMEYYWEKKPELRKNNNGVACLEVDIAGLYPKQHIRLDRITFPEGVTPAEGLDSEGTFSVGNVQGKGPSGGMAAAVDAFEDDDDDDFFDDDDDDE